MPPFASSICVTRLCNDPIAPRIRQVHRCGYTPLNQEHPPSRRIEFSPLPPRQDSISDQVEGEFNSLLEHRRFVFFDHLTALSARAETSRWSARLGIFPKCHRLGKQLLFGLQLRLTIPRPPLDATCQTDARSGLSQRSASFPKWRRSELRRRPCRSGRWRRQP